MPRFPTPHRWPLLAVLALTMASAPARSFAAPVPALTWPGAEIPAGQIVELAWSGLPAGTEEMEILLSLDDGRSFPIRVTPELDARERRYRWRVPNLSAARARLRMRLGRGRAEIETAPTPPFRIAGAVARSGPRALFHEGAFWTGLEPIGSPEHGMLAPQAGMDAADPASAAVAVRGRPSLARPAPTTLAPTDAERSCSTAVPPTPAARPPRLTALRI